MDFAFSQDIAAPVAAVHAAVTDFTGFERQALRRGAEVRRISPVIAGTAGPAWDVTFQFRGHDRQVQLTVTEVTETGLRLTGDSQGLAFQMTVDLLPLAAAQTRLSLTFALQPKTLAARLLVQSFKLIRGKIGRNAQKRLATFARDIEARAQR